MGKSGISVKERPQIMLIEDSRLYQKYLIDICIKNEFDYLSAFDGLEAIEMLYTARPDLILLDIHLPGKNGYEICEHIRHSPSINQIPIIFITSNDNQDDIVKGFKLGGNDYVTKPFNQVILESRIRSQLDNVKNRALLNSYIVELESINNKLQEEKEHSEYLASRDHLTGIFNRRYIQSRIMEMIGENHTGTLNFTMALFDIDNFKSVNDQYGHPCGDFVLKEVVNIINIHAREEDCLSRWGGEEFLLMLSYTSLDMALPIVEQIRRAVENHLFRYTNETFNLTITCGISSFQQNENYKSIFKRIDDALYEGKNSGKNKIIIR